MIVTEFEVESLFPVTYGVSNIAISRALLTFSMRLIEQKMFIFWPNNLYPRRTDPAQLGPTRHGVLWQVISQSVQRITILNFKTLGYRYWNCRVKLLTKVFIGYKNIAFLVKPDFRQLFMHFCVYLKSHLFHIKERHKTYQIHYMFDLKKMYKFKLTFLLKSSDFNVTFFLKIGPGWSA